MIGPGMKTYELRGQRNAGTAILAGGPAGTPAATITALFVPFGSTGGISLDIP